MRATDPFDHDALAEHLKLQRRTAWDIDTCVDWSMGVDPQNFLLPLDDSAIAFPGASPEQKRALSQLMGLIVNATISEMEDCLPKLRKYAWDDVLRKYPVNPELEALGDQFFLEEAKHAAAFKRYLNVFCRSMGIEIADLDMLLPKAFGSFFQSAIIENAKNGGHAFWWVVSNVEEVSINIYQGIFRNREHIDPLYVQLHRRHLEEESRHANYALLMLELCRKSQGGLRGWWHRKVDFSMAQLVAAPWVITELQRFFKVEGLKHKHPFFETLATCIPLYEKLSTAQRVRRMFICAPYVSWILNPKQRTIHRPMTQNLGSWQLPFPDCEKIAVEAFHV